MAWEAELEVYSAGATGMLLGVALSVGSDAVPLVWGCRRCCLEPIVSGLRDRNHWDCRCMQESEHFGLWFFDFGSCLWGWERHRFGIGIENWNQAGNEPTTLALGESPTEAPQRLRMAINPGDGITLKLTLLDDAGEERRVIGELCDSTPLPSAGTLHLFVGFTPLGDSDVYGEPEEDGRLPTSFANLVRWQPVGEPCVDVDM